VLAWIMARAWSLVLAPGVARAAQLVLTRRMARASLLVPADQIARAHVLMPACDLARACSMALTAIMARRSPCDARSGAGCLVYHGVEYRHNRFGGPWSGDKGFSGSWGRPDPYARPGAS